jgi:NADH-quinone oxidoreductase subunit M
MQHLISFLIFLPIGAALVGLLIPSGKENFFRFLALGVSILQVIILLFIFQSYSPGEEPFQMVEKTSWITLDVGTWGSLKAEYFVGLDGLSLSMVFLAVLVTLIAVIASWKIDKQVKGYFLLFLLLNGAVVGSFCALDLLLFYLFFEFMLLPMYFLIGIWGGPQREYASIKFFLYTLLGSILILVVVIALYISVKDPLSTPDHIIHSFNMLHMKDPSNFIEGSLLHHNSMWILGPFSARLWAFLFLFVGFAIKLPMVPLHTWLPDAHVEAPTAVSVLLAALLLKIGGYGLLRLAYPVFPDGAIYFSWLIGLFGVISIIYGAMNAMASKDLKRLIAYSSVSHMGFVLLGIASLTVEGISGAVYQMFSHGIISAMLFLLAGVISDRTHDRIIENYSGLALKMPVYTGFIIVAFFASLGLPGFSGFIAEILTLLGAFTSHTTNHLLPAWMAIVAASGLLLSAAYYLWTIQRMFYGKFTYKGNNTMVLADLDQREFSTLLPLALLALCFGIFPQLLLDFIGPFAEQTVHTVLNSGVLNP